MSKESEKKINELFEELVPAEGKADTVAGEIIRAVCRIWYRNSNDGDHIGVGCGNETCNAAARYLQITCHGDVEKIIAEMWGVRDEDKYDKSMDELEKAVIDHISEHPELKEAANSTDMFSFALEKDEDYEDEGEIW